MTSGGLYRVGPLVAAAMLVAVLAGCGRFGREEREPWRAQAEQICLRKGLVKPSAYVERISAISGPGVCGMDFPFRVTAFAGGTVNVTSRQTLGCPMIAALDQWITEVVQPAAQAYYGQPVTDIRMGSYSCRGRNGARGGKLSEHAFGNGVDIFSFRFADGRSVTVEQGWRDQPEEQDFLKQVFVQSCGPFTTVLGPGSNIFHYNHLHLDLARHRGRERIYCRPVIKFTPTTTGPVVANQAYPSQPYPPQAGAAPAPYPAQAYPQATYPQSHPGRSYPTAPAPRPVIKGPLNLGTAPSAPSYGPGSQTDGTVDEEIDPEHDPYAVDK